MTFFFLSNKFLLSATEFCIWVLCLQRLEAVTDMVLRYHHMLVQFSRLMLHYQCRVLVFKALCSSQGLMCNLWNLNTGKVMCFALRSSSAPCHECFQHMRSILVPYWVSCQRMAHGHGTIFAKVASMQWPFPWLSSDKHGLDRADDLVVTVR